MGDQSEDFEFHEDGQLVRLPNGGTYLCYTEHQDGSAVPMQFRLDGDSVKLNRHGAHETRLEFRADRSTTTRYETEYGIIHLEVETTDLVKELNFADHQGMLQASYHLKNNGAVLGSYRIQLQFMVWYCNM